MPGIPSLSPLSSAQRDGQRQTCAAPGPGASSAAGRIPLCSARWRGSASGPAHRGHLQKAGGPGMAKTHSYSSEAPATSLLCRYIPQDVRLF